jgi:hypothetical protein
MNRLSINRVGLTVAALLAAVHFVWAVVVAVGAGQSLLDFASQIHFVEPETVVAPFSLWNATLLVIIAAAVGYGYGAVLATTWNCLAWFGSLEATPHRELMQRRPSKPAGAG